MRLRERPDKGGGKVEECLEVQTNEESHKETKGGGGYKLVHIVGKQQIRTATKNAQYLLHGL
jgi:hypothetical protein